MPYLDTPGAFPYALWPFQNRLQFVTEISATFHPRFPGRRGTLCRAARGIRRYAVRVGREGGVC